MIQTTVTVRANCYNIIIELVDYKITSHTPSVEPPLSSLLGAVADGWEHTLSAGEFIDKEAHGVLNSCFTYLDAIIFIR